MKQIDIFKTLQERYLIQLTLSKGKNEVKNQLVNSIMKVDRNKELK